MLEIIASFVASITSRSASPRWKLICLIAGGRTVSGGHSRSSDSRRPVPDRPFPGGGSAKRYGSLSEFPQRWQVWEPWRGRLPRSGCGERERPRHWPLPGVW